MYLSAERLALANQTAVETFEQCSIAWQAIPHWDTGDPGQAKVRNDVVDKPSFLDLELSQEPFYLTLVQASAPTPDSLLAEVMDQTARLAGRVDEKVLKELLKKPTKVVPVLGGYKPEEILPSLIDARAMVEDAGYRAPSCLLTNTVGLKKLSVFVGGYPATESLLVAANINSLHRSSEFPEVAKEQHIRLLVLGRRQLIAHGNAAEASPGEEPVDLAVSVMPSVEIVGETSTGKIQMAIRLRFATRVKDPTGVVLAQYKLP
jgi:hypothetical protein